MRRQLGYLSFATFSLLASPPHAFVCDTLRTEGLQTTLVILAEAGRPNDPDGLQICETIAELRRHSPTFAELLKVLRASPQLHVFFRHSSDLKSIGLFGRTRFAVGPRDTVAFVDLLLDRTNPALQREAVAHELAHVAEVVCLGPLGNVGALRLRLMGRDDPRKGTTEAPIETPFASTVGRVVGQEAARRSLFVSRFAALARSHGLDGCPSVLHETVALAELSPVVPAFSEDLAQISGN
ncbi:MAG: hypothetical protein FJW27_04455 [Acidimicrobiia bacterium]|nr:hypothetical protein [Acidimicrobiia bacterium]